jgi:DHA2 family multidrug resistance protein-like MFS transporter
MRHVYPVKLLARGIAINAMNVAVTSVIGPTISSLILTFASWRWMFVSVTPLIILAALVMRHLPDVPTIKVRFDVRAAVTSALAIGLFILGLDQLAKDLVYAMLYLAAGLVLAVWVLRYSSLQTRPLVPVDLLRIAAIRSALAASVSSFAAQMAIFVALPFYLFNTYGHDPLTVGLLMACWPLGAVIMAAVASRLVERFEVALLCAIGALAMGLGALLIVLLPADAAMAWLMFVIILIISLIQVKIGNRFVYYESER